MYLITPQSEPIRYVGIGLGSERTEWVTVHITLGEVVLTQQEKLLMAILIGSILVALGLLYIWDKKEVNVQTEWPYIIQCRVIMPEDMK